MHQAAHSQRNDTVIS